MTAERVAVFDTNVVVSGMLSPHGPPGRIIEWLRGGTIRAGPDDRVAAEYAEVLHRPELGLPPREVDLVLSAILAHALWARIKPEHLAADVTDPDDAAFAECARSLDCCLVTGNKRHYARASAHGLMVLSPREFVEKVAGSAKVGRLATDQTATEGKAERYL